VKVTKDMFKNTVLIGFECVIGGSAILDKLQSIIGHNSQVKMWSIKAEASMTVPRRVLS